jgi:hypothetical protein
MRTTTGAQWRRTSHAGRGDLASPVLAGGEPANAHDARHATDTTGAFICSPIRIDLIRRANFLDSSNIAGSVFLGEDPGTNALPVHQRNFRNSDAVRPVVDTPGSNSHNCNSDAGTTPPTRTLRMGNTTHGYDSKSPRRDYAILGRAKVRGSNDSAAADEVCRPCPWNAGALT